MNTMPLLPPDPIAPPRLRPGDTIGLLAPAGPIRDQEAFANGLRILRDLGLKVKYAEDLMRATGYLAGDESRRAQEFHQLWDDREVKALLTVRGGYGCLRLLPHLDLDLCRRQPKILVGFSDISVLLNAIHGATGLITFHGPNLCSLASADRPSLEAFFNILGRPTLEPIKAAGLEILKPGTARGPLRGGNLASLTHLLATPFETDLAEALLFIEDVNEPAYRIDRMLTQLQQAGRLASLGGLILGTFNDCGDEEIIWNRALELFTGQNIPIWAGFPTGHTARNHILPIGIEAEMDSGSGVLRFLTPATSGD